MVFNAICFMLLPFVMLGVGMIFTWAVMSTFNWVALRARTAEDEVTTILADLLESKAEYARTHEEFWRLTTDRLFHDLMMARRRADSWGYLLGAVDYMTFAVSV